VVYRQDRSGAGARGITAFLIEKGFKGFLDREKLDKFGMRGSDTRAGVHGLRGAGGERPRRCRRTA